MAGTRTNRVVLLITYLNIVLYALCFQLQRPVEPFLIKSLSEKAGDATHVESTYALLNSFFSILQTIGSPLVGLLLDRVGIRNASAIVFMASATSYQILASATTLNLLFFSKIPTVLQGAFLVAQATAATSTGGSTTARAAALGRMTTAYTIGATIGPAIGGYLVDYGDLYLSAKMAVFGSLISVVLSLLYLPNVKEGRPDKNTNDASPLEKTRSFKEEVRRTGRIASRPRVWPLLLIKVAGGVAASMYSTAMTLTLSMNLNFEASQIGLSISTGMLAVALFGAVGMAPLASFLGASGLSKAGLLSRATMAVAMAAIIGTTTSNETYFLVRIIIASVFHDLASHALATGVTTQTTGIVTKDEQGALLGLEHGLFSLARIVGPPLGACLLSIGGGGVFWYVAFACATVDMVLVGFLTATEGTEPSIHTIHPD